jgi:hypothetical protein
LCFASDCPKLFLKKATARTMCHLLVPVLCEPGDNRKEAVTR